MPDEQAQSDARGEHEVLPARQVEALTQPRFADLLGYPGKRSGKRVMTTKTMRGGQGTKPC